MYLSENPEELEVYHRWRNAPLEPHVERAMRMSFLDDKMSCRICDAARKVLQLDESDTPGKSITPPKEENFYH
jgi:hypothetical protein